MLDGRGGGSFPVVESDVLQHRFVENTLVTRRNRSGEIDLFDEFAGLVADSVAGGQGGDERDGMLCLFKPGYDGGHGGLEFGGGALLALDLLDGLAGDWRADQMSVPGELRDHDVGWLALAQSLADHAFELVDAIVRSQDGGHAGGGPRNRDESVVVGVPKVVMGNKGLPLDAFARHSDQMKDGQSVCHAPHDTVDRGEFAHAVGRGEERCPPDTGIAVGSIRGVQFISADDPL